MRDAARQPVERPLVFDCEGDALLGIVHAADGDTGVLVVVGGPQYRVGSHRQFVRLARALASGGHPTMRFDVRGMGDSEGQSRSFERTGADIGAAIDAFQLALPTVRRVVLLGLCDGASAALLYLHERRDPRLCGLCLLNPWVRSAATLASVRVRHYYLKRVMQRDFWAKFLRGGVSLRAPLEFVRQIGAARARPTRARGLSFQERMRLGWAGFDGSTLLVLSEDDLTAQEFAQTARGDAGWSTVLGSSRVEQCIMPDADHTFSANGSHERLVERMLAWIGQLRAAAPAT
jgi:exosortase A-associated hydrolase 1